MLCYQAIASNPTGHSKKLSSLHREAIKGSCGNTESNLTNNRELLQGVSSALICYARIDSLCC